MRRKNSSIPIPTQIPLFPLAGHEARVELAAPQQQELIRALAELLLHAAAKADPKRWIAVTAPHRAGRRPWRAAVAASQPKDARRDDGKHGAEPNLRTLVDVTRRH